MAALYRYNLPNRRLTHVYRLLRNDEDPAKGLTAKDPTATVSIIDHVLHGSKEQRSQYISTSDSYDSLRNFATRIEQDKNIRIVKIFCSGLDIIDLTDADCQNEHFECYDNAVLKKARERATRNAEAVIVGHIPAQCMSLIYSGLKSKLPVVEPNAEV